MSAAIAAVQNETEAKSPKDKYLIRPERASYKAREILRAQKFVKSLAGLHSAAQGIGAKQAALDIIEAAGVAVDTMLTKVLASMPEDIAPPRGSQSRSAEAGDVVNALEEFSFLYSAKLDKDLTVKEVLRAGGNAEGKGVKTFLKCKRTDGTVVTVPASHFE